MNEPIQRDSLQDRIGNAACWLGIIFGAVSLVAVGGMKGFWILVVSIIVGYGLRYLITGRDD